MKRYFLIFIFVFSSVACNAGYGPLEDHSKFTSAKLADDGKHVVFSYHRFLYRRATGIRAFPDGGIPKYETDVIYLGVYDRKSGQFDILRREDNRTWQPGHGHFTVQAVNGPFALVGQGGQLRGPFALDTRHALVNFKKKTIVDLDLDADLAAHGRDPGQIYLAAPDGTLVFKTPSVREAQTANPHREPGFVPEIWVRTPQGDYLKVATSNHYERMINGEVIYWLPDTRKFMAFSVVKRSTRELPGYKTPPYEDVTVGVSLSSDRKSMEYGTRTDQQWTYQPIPLDPAQFK